MRYWRWASCKTKCFSRFTVVRKWDVVFTYSVVKMMATHDFCALLEKKFTIGDYSAPTLQCQMRKLEKM